MARVDAYHTIISETPPERDVYHNYDACPAGMKIKPEHKASGTARRPLCEDCK